MFEHSKLGYKKKKKTIFVIDIHLNILISRSSKQQGTATMLPPLPATAFTSKRSKTHKVQMTPLEKQSVKKEVVRARTKTRGELREACGDLRGSKLDAEAATVLLDR